MMYIYLQFVTTRAAHLPLSLFEITKEYTMRPLLETNAKARRQKNMAQ
jgi:hypothetical protein